MLEFIKIINSDYAGVLSLLSSLIMVVVTIIYVDTPSVKQITLRNQQSSLRNK